MTTVLEDARRVHQFLQSPTAYPDPTATVTLKETHISWLYLTERHVYKQKKPVRFEFLDFTTLDQRKYYCEQEVMLNRRFSPNVYLGVVPVSRDSSGGLHLKPGKHIVEWLVKMRRLDEQQTLESLIREHQLTDNHIQRLSDRLTKIYAEQAPAMVRSNDFLRRLRQHILANRNDLLISLTARENEIHFATNGLLRCLALESDYFVQRVADGRVVDGHGDLRPEHIYFHRSNPLIIDCVEFESEYRTNDVVDELAFLSMECDRLGNLTVGQTLFDAYLQAGHDEPRPYLSTFYKCYRSCVRAKVEGLRAAQEDKTHKARSLEISDSYLTLAKQYAEKIGPKIVLIVGGLSGTGKSTLSTLLQEPLAAELLQTDVVRNKVFAQPQGGNGKYTRESRQRVYDALIEHMAVALSRSPTLILDGTFTSAANRRAVCQRAAELNAIVLQVQCECAPWEAQQRISERRARGHASSEATPEVHVEQARECEAIIESEEAIVVDTAQPGQMQVELVLDKVQRLVH